MCKQEYYICMQVYLEQEDGRGCIFKILPRYKVQSVGEEVRYSDQVKLESVATEGQFLHCGEKTFGEVHININKDWLVQHTCMHAHNNEILRTHMGIFLTAMK